MAGLGDVPRCNGVKCHQNAIFAPLDGHGDSLGFADVRYGNPCSKSLSPGRSPPLRTRQWPRGRHFDVRSGVAAAPLGGNCVLRRRIAPRNLQRTPGGAVVGENGGGLGAKVGRLWTRFPRRLRRLRALLHNEDVSTQRLHVFLAVRDVRGLLRDPHRPARGRAQRDTPMGPLAQGRTKCPSVTQCERRRRWRQLTNRRLIPVPLTSEGETRAPAPVAPSCGSSSPRLPAYRAPPRRGRSGAHAT